MTGPAAQVLAAGLELADLHRDATKELERHRPNRDGICTGCGDTYPCAEEWITMRAITGIENRWRREGQRLAEIVDAERAQDQAATTAAGDERQET